MAVSVCIHRGADTIGGSCIEVKASTGERILLDAGRPLDVPSGVLTPVPESLDRHSPVAGVFISHAHMDHCGLISQLPQTWPVYCGKDTEALLRLSLLSGGEHLEHPCKHFSHNRPFSLGPFTITPYLVDHSAFDAYALHIEVEGKSLFYSGDIRAHGRKAFLTENLLAHPPKADVLLLEGTNLPKQGVHAKPTPTESELEHEFAKAFTESQGRIFISTSSSNIDRLVTLYRACKRSGRTLVVDLYTMLTLRTLQHHERIPQPHWEGGHLRVVITKSMLRHLKRMGQDPHIEDLKKYRVALGAEALESAKAQKSVIVVRDSLARDFAAKNVIPTSKDSWIFSLWGGYLQQDCTKVQREFLAPCSFKHMHTSGHAPLKILQKIATAFTGAKLVPVHGEAWPEHMATFDTVFSVANGQWMEI